MEFKKEVLIIDDDKVILESIKKQLRHNDNLDLEFIDDPVAGLEKINEHKFDLIICDVRMKNLNGLDVLKLIKSNHPELPVIILSGYVDDKMIEKAYNLGCYDFLVKPVRKTALLETISKALNTEL